MPDGKFITRMATGSKKILVLGSGMVALETGLALQKQCPDSSVTLCSIRDPSFPVDVPACSAFIIPEFATSPTDKELIKASWEYYHQLFMNPSEESNPETNGVFPVPVYELSSKLRPEFACSTENSRIAETGTNLIGQTFTKCGRRERNLFQPDDYWQSGKRQMSYAINMDLYIPWMTKKFAQKGTIIQYPSMEIFLRDFTKEIFSSYNVLIDCIGEELLQKMKGDPANIGNQPRNRTIHTIKIKAPWIKFVLVADDIFIQPSMDHAIVGVRGGVGSRPKSASEILSRVSKTLPTLREATILEHDITSYEEGGNNALPFDFHTGKGSLGPTGEKLPPVVICGISPQNICYVPSVCQKAARDALRVLKTQE